MFCEDITFPNYIIKYYKFDNYKVLVKIYHGEILGYKKLVNYEEINDRLDLIEIQKYDDPIIPFNTKILMKETSQYPIKDDDGFPFFRTTFIDSNQILSFEYERPIDMTLKDKSIFMYELKKHRFQDKIYQEWSDVICTKLLLEIREYNINSLI
jgi:hypothetical protein